MSEPLSAADVQIAARLEPPSITVGDVATLTVSVIHPEGATVQGLDARAGEASIPVQAGGALGPLEVRAVKAPERLPSPGGKLETRLTADLFTLEPGEHALPELSVRVAVPGSEPLVVHVPVRTLRVASVLEGVSEEDLAKADIKDIKGPLTVAPDYTVYVLASVGLAALLAAVLLVRMLLRRRRRPAPAPAPALPPYEEAVAALDALKGQGLPARGAWKEFALALSEILRRYIGRRFDLPAPEWTSREVMQGIAASTAFALLPESERARERLRLLLDDTDLVKFAKWQPPLSAEGELLASSYAFLEMTRPRAETPVPLPSPVARPVEVSP